MVSLETLNKRLIIVSLPAGMLTEHILYAEGNDWTACMAYAGISKRRN